MRKNVHLVVVGFDEIVTDKYIQCVDEAIRNGDIDAYSVIDLLSQKTYIEAKIAELGLKPETVYYLPDPPGDGVWAVPDDYEPIFKEIIARKGKIKVYIATEVKAHEAYLRFCVENGIDSLVEKPVLSPMKDGYFDPSAITPILSELCNKIDKTPAHHSVMTLGRYHRIYNQKVMASVKQKMEDLHAPLTSFHFRTAGGVWNLHREYLTRDDHPYKQGYGMLMHGAYHYIDLVAQFLGLNRALFPDDVLSLTLSAFAAYPTDQNDRISRKFSYYFDDHHPTWADETPDADKFGETDITATFCLRNMTTGKAVTVGTMSFEQTTPSIRAWKEIPEGIYNKNGRISNVDIEVQLSTLHSVNVQCFDIPIGRAGDIERMDAFARISTRTNASLLVDEEYNSTETFNGLFHSDSNRDLMRMWLRDEETKSRLHDHVPVMRLVQALAEAIQQPGYPVTFDFT